MNTPSQHIWVTPEGQVIPEKEAFHLIAEDAKANGGKPSKIIASCYHNVSQMCDVTEKLARANLRLMALTEAMQDVGLLKTTLESEQARESLSTFVPHLKVAIEGAKLSVPGGKVKLAVIVEKPDGSGGQITARFEMDEFLSDIEDVLSEVST